MIMASTHIVPVGRAMILRKVLRLVDMIQLFQRRDRAYSAGELAERYKVHLSSVYRDLIDLQELGMPLVVESCRWRLMD